METGEGRGLSVSKICRQLRQERQECKGSIWRWEKGESKGK